MTRQNAPMWLAIEGVVGAGKTTTAALLANLTDFSVALERSDQHPLLEDYYRDPLRFAFETELVFMALQAHQIALVNAPIRLVSDFAPAKNFVFARSTCAPADLRLLERVDSRLWGQLPKPDLTVVLDVPAEVCKQRIKNRGREYEQGLDVPDLEQLREGYMKSLQELGREVRSLVLTGAESPKEVADAVVDTADL